MRTRTLFLHLGYPKTATTFVQKEVMSRVEKVVFLNRPHSDLLPRKHSWNGILRRFFASTPLVWEDLGEALFRELTDADDERDVLISDENVLDMTMDPVGIREHLARLVACAEAHGFPRVRVLVTIRQQATRFGSMYAQLSRRFKGAGQKHFETWVRHHLTPQGYYGSLGHYGDGRKGVMMDYNRIFDQLTQAVDEASVTMLPFERLTADPESFVREVLRFIELDDDRARPIVASIAEQATPRNVRSVSDRQWSVRERPSSTYTVHLRPARLFHATGLPATITLPTNWNDIRSRRRRDDHIRLTPDLIDTVMDRYRDSNARLSDRLNLGLDAYEYF